MGQVKHNSIYVAGETSYNHTKPALYTAYVHIKELIPDGYSYVSDKKTVDQVFTDYKNKLVEKKVDVQKLKENELLFFYTGYQESVEQKFYTFKTTSQSEFKTFLKTKINGIYFLNIEVFFDNLSTEDIAGLSAKAINDARERAEKIAEKMNRKIGKVLYIENKNTKNVYSNYYQAPNIHAVGVEFELL
ncbi:SIMPL domain-containing protein [Abyssalbus ytuae]|uniref:SIMPL domain-containing protein n=1 Tax=Abyssalbus ytuae TaxID=2926907 RepID=A0A9E6ZQ90_9FLAO|nr:SIMPL domain-containing protein [Abyssalbus ytuae]UOB18515.1 SIMPL domain-containing protein [Abyssalbus ytuae]